jgi:Tol biopolymer transport system component
VSDPDGTHLHLLPLQGRAPSSSPDGDTIAFDRPGSACPSGCGDLYVAKLTDTHATKIVPNGRAAAWSPDGEQILFERKRAACVVGSTCSDIWTVKPDGSAPALWTRDAKAPSWSPDGKHAAFVRVNNTAVVCSSEIWITDDDGGVKSFDRIVTSSGTQVLNVAWSPDSERLAVARHDSKRCQRGDKSEYGLWTMNRDGSAPKRIASAADRVAWLGAERLAFERVNCTPTFCPPPDVFTVSPSGSHLRPLRTTTAWPALI